VSEWSVIDYSESYEVQRQVYFDITAVCDVYVCQVKPEAVKPGGCEQLRYPVGRSMFWFGKLS